jgi:hypothetical protein
VTSFRESLKRILMPRWAQGPNASRYLHALGAVIDGVADQFLFGVRARFPSEAPDDALPHLGRDRGIVRGFAEPRAGFEERLRGWIYDRKRKGNNYTLMRQLRGYLTGFAVPMAVVNNHGAWYLQDEDGITDYQFNDNWDWDGEDTFWARFWPILHVPSDLWQIEGDYGDGETWGDGGTWGTTATYDQIRTLRAIVEEWRSAHSSVPQAGGIILAFDPASFDPTNSQPPLPDGTWANYSNTVAGVQVPARLTTARYVQGVP